MSHEVDDNDVQSDFASAVDFVSNMFAEVMDKDAVISVVESCGGNVQHAIEAIMMMNDTPSQNKLNSEQIVQGNQSAIEPTKTNDTLEPPKVSYAMTSKSTGAIPKKQSPKNKVQVQNSYLSQENINTILHYHDQGHRIMVIMRGLPGSGKSHLARQIVAATAGYGSNTNLHVFSTDDFFYRNNHYKYDRNRLGEAHDWNQSRVHQNVQKGVSPIIVDNTNMKIWEMTPYAIYGINQGYYIEVMEPNTPWARNPRELAKKNKHGVPKYAIDRMLDNYEQCPHSSYLIRVTGITYPYDKIPPVLRNYPPLRSIDQDLQESTSKITLSEPKTTTTKNTPQPSGPREDDLEREWDAGESWFQDSQEHKQEAVLFAEPKPPRKPRTNSANTQERLLPTVDDGPDWSVFTKFLPSWDSTNASPSIKTEPEIAVDTTSRGTSIDIDDTNITNCKYRIIIGTPKDINFYYIPCYEQIPKKRKLDKSTMTNDGDFSSVTGRCKNEEKHFIALRKLFRNISKVDLREIFDRCYGDVNWAVNIVVDGVGNNEIKIEHETALSDTDDECPDQCECMAAYNIIPDNNTNNENIPTPPPVVSTSQLFMPKRTKKDKSVSENSIQIKKQIEQNVVISDDHYSEHCLKIRKLYRGESNIESDAMYGEQACGFDTAASRDSEMPEDASDDNSDSESESYEDETVTVNMGPDFIKQLDIAFGRSVAEYQRENIVPLVSMPVSMLNSLNALWLESLTYQLQSQAEYSKIMMLQDEEFARQLAEKESEMAAQGQEPPVPDLKEIMDMDLALSIHQKSIDSQLKQQEPNDMAARMTRDKLQNLFPDIAPNVLSELLMAHDNNFQTTVEVLLTSTGQTNILEQKNGINKFVMEKEMQRQEKIIAQKRKELDEREFPPLTQGVKVDMSTVDLYREEAQKNIDQRNLVHLKAQHYMNRGMTKIASYYADVANFYRKNFELANCMAATTLVQVNSEKSNRTTLDLHHFFVKEAIATLDLFLDHHIQVLQEANRRGPVSYRTKTLFFITGRGLHSPSGPKVKPAVKRRLIERGYRVTLVNPGLLSVDIRCDNKLSHQLP